MYIQRNKSVNKKTGKVYHSVILSAKYREGAKVKTRAIANLSHLPEHVILSIQNTLKSETDTVVSLKDIEVTKCFDYGYVFVLQSIMKQLRIDQVLEKTLSATDASRVKAMLIGKIVTGGSKLCIYNWLSREKDICELLGEDMKGCKEQVRAEYKNLQNVEHAFRDLKSDNISIRPVYHCNENQTGGHVQLCMFAYAIIKTMENALFPFLKEYNQANKTQLAFHDLIEELKNIKMCELAIGNKVKSAQHPKLNKLQKKIIEALNVKFNSMVKIA